MRVIDHPFRVLYSELVQRCLDAAFSADFAIEGRFVTAESRGRRYWYFDTPTETGSKKRRYVGPADDPDITGRVEAFKNLKADARARRKLVSTLVREAGLPRPDPMAGDIVRALADAGLFRLRCVLVGTLAFGAYSAVLGARLGGSLMGTGDADVAQFHSISAAVGDALPPILDVLRSVDATFRELPHISDGRASTRFRAASGFLVEFLTPNTGSADYEGRPAVMPALGGAAAEPLRFLDFLIHEPIRAVLLHGSGIPVLVPAPERYAVHKLIVATRRRDSGDGTAKAAKDRQQAITLLSAMVELRREVDVADAWMEAWDRGPSWRNAIAASLNVTDETVRVRVVNGVARGIVGLGADPSAYGVV